MAKADEIKVGSRVRSFDFFHRDLEGERACYVEGVVETVGEVIEGCPRYAIRVTRSVFGGKPSKRYSEDAVVYPPVNGTPSLLSGLTNYVELLDE